MNLPRVLLFAATATCMQVCAAQVPGTPGPPLPVPEQSNLPVNLPLNPNLPTIFIVGDSTARNKADLGWGDHFAHYFDTTRVNIANRAIAGRSSRSYINEGSWDKTLAQVKPGDYVLIQMGHNDGGTPVSDAFRGRGSGKGIGDETAETPVAVPFTIGPLAGKTVETLHTYGWYLRKYIADTRAKGAAPILLTVTVRDIWTFGPDGKLHIERDMGFRDYEYEVGAVEHHLLAAPAQLRPLEVEQDAALGGVQQAAVQLRGGLLPEAGTLVADEALEAARLEVGAAALCLCCLRGELADLFVLLGAAGGEALRVDEGLHTQLDTA